jgi:GAG-pre-integrase domain
VAGLTPLIRSIYFWGVTKIIQDLNCDVIFSPNKVTFQDRVTGKKIGEGMFKNGLYYLEDTINKCFVSVSHVDRDKLLHCRFGHPSDQVLNKFFCYKLDSSNCDICKLAKQTRLSFPSSTSISENYFDLIHSDVCGPAPIDSYNNFMYFVTFIDDYSRTTWIYLLKAKNEVFSCFQEFFNFIVN